MSAMVPSGSLSMTTGRSPSGMWDISGILTITMLGLSQVHVSWSGVAVQEVAMQAYCRICVLIENDGGDGGRHGVIWLPRLRHVERKQPATAEKKSEPNKLS